MWRTLLLTMSTAAAAMGALTGASIYRDAPPDPGAVVLQADRFPVHGDGVGDDTDALQAAINHVQETQARGVVLLPPGRYRLTRTVHVWSGIRLIGYGERRPVLVLAERTPGFAEGDGKYLLHFTAGRPKPGEPIRDANPGTFYSGLSNIDLEIGAGNPAAIGVRSHFAQHCFLAHVDFHTGSGRAGVEEVGNEIEACRFFGGDYGILTKKPSPSWPFLLIDSAFAGQRVAAIRTEEAGMTVIRGDFREVPTVVLVNAERSEELFIQDSVFRQVGGPALVISEEANARTQVNLANVACADVPRLARFRSSGREVAGPAAQYVVRQFSHGLHQDGAGAQPGIATRLEAEPVDALPAPVASDVPLLPPVATWTSVRDFGARGDGTTDDTAALRAAIAAAEVLFFPAGRYLVSDTLTLRPETVLIGLSPISTQIVLADATPAFLGAGAGQQVPRSMSGVRFQVPVSQGTGEPKPLLETPPGGRNLVNGLGLDTGINNRAVAAKWRAGAGSLMNDVRFHGGHGTYAPDGSSLPIYNNNRTADADATRRWDSQFWSLWVTDGGGGTFKNIWTPNPFAAAGLYVSDTATPGRVYAMSVEHHVRNEVILRRAANWSFYALQFEEERGEGPEALPVDIEDCADLTFANLYLYRVMTTYSPFPYGVRVRRSTGLRFRGVHVYSPSKYTVDTTLYDESRRAGVPWREIARLDWPGAAVAATPERPSAWRLERLADGFNSIDHLAVDPRGNVTFVDARWQRIHHWDHRARELRLLRDHPLEPVGLVYDARGELVVVTRLGTVYTFDPARAGDGFEVLVARPGPPPAAAATVHPLTRWRDSHDFLEVATAREPWHFVSRDGSTVLPAAEEFVRAGAMSSYFSTIDLIRAYGFGRAAPGERFYVADEFGQKTWRFQVGADGTLTAPELFAEEGEAGVAVDPEGNVYVAAGEIFVFRPDGTLRERIAVPERPTGLAFGGERGWTLFIAARRALYAAELR